MMHHFQVGNEMTWTDTRVQNSLHKFWSTHFLLIKGILIKMSQQLPLLYCDSINDSFVSFGVFLLKHPAMFPVVCERFGLVHPLCPAAVWPGGVHPVSVGARSLRSAGGLPRSDGHPPGLSPRSRLLAGRAAEYRLRWGVIAADTSRP